MTAVVCAAFDAGADAQFERLRAEVEAAGHRVRRSHRPHLTLAAARPSDVADVVTLAREVAARHRPVPLRMAALGSFPSGVLYVRPDPSSALTELQRDVHATLLTQWPSAFGPQTDPNGWAPHATLATRLARPELSRLRAAPFTPFEAVVEALAVIVVGGRGDIAHVPLTG